MHRIDLGSFRNLLEKCMRLPEFQGQSRDDFQKLIIQNICGLALRRSGILADPESLTDFLPSLQDLLLPWVEKHLIGVEPWILPGLFYEALLSFNVDEGGNGVDRNKLIRKSRGIFYTSPETAMEFIRGILAHLPEGRPSENLRVLDLASGYGIFSIIILLQLKAGPAFVDSYRHFFEREPKTETVGRLYFLMKNLTCIDNDPYALRISRYSILLAALSTEESSIRFAKFNAIYETINGIQQQDIMKIYANTLLEDGGMGQYDLVVSNPPYISYYSRQSNACRLTERERYHIYRNLVFREGLKGRFNSVMLFMDYAIRSVSPGGLAGFLVDMNIHEDLFSGMREFIIREKTILEVRVNAKSFSHVKSGQCWLYFQNNPPAADSRYRLIDNTPGLVPGNGAVEAADILQEPLGKKFSLLGGVRRSFVEKMEEGRTLSQVARISTGVNVGGSSSEFIFSGPIKSDAGLGYYPFASVGQIRERYEFSSAPDPVYFHFDQDKANRINIANQKRDKKNILVLGNIERFLGPKLFIRQSANEIIAACVIEPMICPYSMFVLNSTGNVSLHAILGVLNSDLMTMYARETGIIRSGEGKQPQIRKKGLDSLPFPGEKLFGRYVDDLEKCVKKLLAMERNCGERDSIKLYIEKLVARMFELELCENGDYR